MNRKNKTKPKSKWDFNNISWKQFIEYEYRSILNLDKIPCKLGECKKNCNDNLYCLNGLGEENWLNNLKNVSNGSFEDIDSSSNFAAGLKNYGSTCYLNSLLQVYFNIYILRASVFDFPTMDIPDEIMKYLQAIFAQMQLSLQKCVDPVELINALELPQLEQQDAPEFHNLFMSLLDARFETIENPIIKDLFTGQQSYCTKCLGCDYSSEVSCEFREIDLKLLSSIDLAFQDFLKVEMLVGDNKYRCASCGNLCVGERQTLLKKLPPLLCLQLLRYSYDNYGNKKKNLSNISFPSQLNTSQYLNNPINEVSDANTYILKGILIHIGSEPTSGHYQSIVHTSNDEWVFYDDTNVTKLDSVEDVQKALGSKKSVLPKTKNSIINFYSSNAYMLFYQRYDLFNQNLDPSSTFNIPDHLNDNIKQVNECYLSEIETQKVKQQEKQMNWKKQSEKVEECLQHLLFTTSYISEKDNDNSTDQDKNQLILLPTFRLQNWLMSPGPLSNWDSEFCFSHYEDWKSLYCKGKHNLLGPDLCLGQIKAVRRRGFIKMQDYRFLSSQYRPMTLDDLCHKCWRLKFELKKFENTKKQNVQMIENSLKKSELYNPNEKQFWVSKTHLRQWKKIIRHFIEYYYSDIAILANNTENGDGVEAPTNGTDNLDGEIEKSGSGDEDDNVTIFNSDIVCQHNDLCIDASKRIIVSHEVWYCLKAYFTELMDDNCENSSVVLYHELQCSNCSFEGCIKCLAYVEEIIEKAEREKQQLSNLLTSKKRFEYDSNQNLLNCLIPSILESESNKTNASTTTNSQNISETSTSARLYLIPCSFLVKWRRFIKNPSIDTIVSELDYSDVFCDHGKLLYNKWYNLIDDDSLTIVLSHEWDRIIDFYPTLPFEEMRLECVRISINNNTKMDTAVDDKAGNNNSVLLQTLHTGVIDLISVSNSISRWGNLELVTNNVICDICYHEWNEEQFSFNNATVFIRLISDYNGINAYKDGENECLVDNTDNTIVDEDIEMSEKHTGNKKAVKRKSKSKKLEKPTKMESIEDLSNVRRSNRSKRQRNDVTVRISSTDTVKDLKLQLMVIYNASPIDQHIIFHERELIDLSTNLSSVGIRPASILYLILDSPNGTGNNVNNSAIETGFIGTKLMDSNRF